MEYVRQACKFPTAAQGAVLEKETKHSKEHWFILTSLSPDQASADQLLKWIRGHWQIENGLHHVKDRTLKEDEYSGQDKNMIHCLTVLRNGVVSLLNRLTLPQNRRVSRPKHQIELRASLTKTCYLLTQL